MPKQEQNKPLIGKQRQIQVQQAKEDWNALSVQLPDVPDITIDEIVAEVKEVRVQNR